MAQQTNLVQEGVDRVRETVSSIESDLEKAQKRMRREFRSRSKSIEKQVATRRRQTERQVKRLQKEINKNPYVKRARGAMDDATKQIERGVDSVFEALNVASRRDLKRIDRKLNQINRKLSGIEQATPAKASKASKVSNRPAKAS